MNTTKACWEYWETCKNYWVRTGNSEELAAAKAYWYDCREVWDFDHSWNDAKREFTHEFLLAFPTCSKPC